MAACLLLLQLPASTECQAPAPDTPGLDRADEVPAGGQLASITTTTGPPTTISIEQFEPTQATSASNGTTNRLKPVNFTLVDEIFESSLNDDEVVKRWKNMDAQFQDGIRSILKLVFPQIVAISQDAKVSGDCSGGILKWILSLRNLRSWAIKSK